MKDKIIVNICTDHAFECETDIIGREGEGYATRFEITIPEVLNDCAVYLDFEKPSGEKFRTPKLRVKDGVAVYDPVPYLLTERGEIKVQAVLIDAEGETWKSSVKKYNVQYSINAFNDDIPQKEDFMFKAQKAIEAFSQALTEIAETLSNDKDFAEDVASTFEEFVEQKVATVDRELISEIAKKLQLPPAFANNISECTDTSRFYVLPDGFIYAYLTKEFESEPTNEFNSSTASYNKRISGTSGSESTGNGAVSTPFIEFGNTNPYLVKIKGVPLATYIGYGFYVQATYYKDGAYVGKTYFSTVAETAQDFRLFESYDATNQLYTVDIYRGDLNANQVRITLCLNDKSTSISSADTQKLFIEFVPKTEPAEKRSDWDSTGRAFIPTNYEDRIVGLEEKTEQIENSNNLLDEKIETLKEDVNILSSGVITIPDYWQYALDEAVDKIKALQDVGGANTVNFVYFSDLHYTPSDNYIQHVGKLCASVMDKCNIPLALMAGDTMTNGALATEGTLLEYIAGASELLSPIGANRLLQIRGNHDDVWGTYSSGDTSVYYVNKVAQSKMWNRMHRASAQDFRRVYGGDGTYFYIDNVPQKTRVVCLNAHFYDGKEITSGTTKMMTTGFGTEQLAWLNNVALNVGDEWCVVIATHVPPTSKAINGVTSYLSQYSDGDEFRNIISTTSADIAGIFCGHCHADAVVTSDLPCPIITITCASNYPYDNSVRTVRSEKETAIDIVSINKSKRKIYLTRLGAGIDREINY